MITQALRHFPGIGPARLAKLRQAGVCTWSDVLEFPDRIPVKRRAELLAESERCLQALDAGRIEYFVQRFAAPDKWRILSQYLPQTTFFDIETMGLEYDAPITVIVCWHAGRLHSFVEHENLDDFLVLLDEVELLASFNGSSFDVPRVLNAFHIPELPCPHLDLRWSCYHERLRGGLKDIASRLGIRRPLDLQDADGAMAVRLWSAWEHGQDQGARQQLLRYCAADVLMLVMLAQRLTKREDWAADALWSQLPPAAETSCITQRLTAYRTRMVG